MTDKPESRSLVGPFKRSAEALLDEVDVAFDLLKDNSKCKVMLDVGAHHGSSLWKFAKENWRVFAFEPDPANRKILSKRISKLENVRLSDQAVSDVAEEGRPFFTSDVSTGISGLSSFHISHKETAIVSTTTVKDVCEKESLDCLSFLKIDTEGYDLFVLRGVDWGRARPEVIVCEYEDAKTKPLGYSMSDMANFLLEKGYIVYVSEWHPIIEYGQTHQWNRFYRYVLGESYDEKRWGNLLAVSEVDEEKLLKSINSRLTFAGKKQILSTPDVAISGRSKGVFTNLLSWLARTFREGSKRSRWTLGFLLLVSFAVAFAWPKLIVLSGGAFLLGLVSLYLQDAGYFRRKTTALKRLLHLSREVDDIQAQLRKLHSAQKKIIDRQDGLRAVGDKQAAVLQDILKNVGRLSNDNNEFGSKISRIEEDRRVSPISNFTKYQRFPREIKEDDVDRILSEWSGKLDVPLTRKGVFYLAHRICVAEQVCEGRMATSIQTAVLRALVASSVKKSKLQVLEIGTLYGIALGAIHEYCQHLYDDVEMTVIDPLSGYYDEGRLDALVNIPVNRRILTANFRRLGVDGVKIIEGMSEDEEVIQEAAKKQYDLLIIDGDHSYEGVKSDFENYLPFISQGGYVIFDDYDTDDWPEIKSFVDKSVKTRKDLAFIGCDWRTAVFQVK